MDSKMNPCPFNKMDFHMFDSLSNVIKQYTTEDNSGCFTTSDFYMVDSIDLDKPLPTFTVNASTYSVISRNKVINKKVVLDLNCFDFVASKLYNNIDFKIIHGTIDRYETVDVEHDWVKYIFNLKSNDGHIQIGNSEFFLSWQKNERENSVVVRHNYGEVDIHFKRGVTSYRDANENIVDQKFIESLRERTLKSLEEVFEGKSNSLENRYVVSQNEFIPDLLTSESLLKMRSEFNKKQ